MFFESRVISEYWKKVYFTALLVIHIRQSKGKIQDQTCWQSTYTTMYTWTEAFWSTVSEWQAPDDRTKCSKCPPWIFIQALQDSTSGTVLSFTTSDWSCRLGFICNSYLMVLYYNLFSCSSRILGHVSGQITEQGRPIAWPARPPDLNLILWSLGTS